MSDSVVSSELPDEEAADRDEVEEQEADVDETLATRRLRHWLRGMFGGGGDPPNTSLDAD